MFAYVKMYDVYRQFHATSDPRWWMGMNMAIWIAMLFYFMNGSGIFTANHKVERD